MRKFRAVSYQKMYGARYLLVLTQFMDVVIVNKVDMLINPDDACDSYFVTYKTKSLDGVEVITSAEIIEFLAYGSTVQDIIASDVIEDRVVIHCYGSSISDTITSHSLSQVTEGFLTGRNYKIFAKTNYGSFEVLRAEKPEKTGDGWSTGSNLDIIDRPQNNINDLMRLIYLMGERDRIRYIIDNRSRNSCDKLYEELIEIVNEIDALVPPKSKK